MQHCLQQTAKKRKYTSKYAAVDNKRIENAIREVQSEESTKKHASVIFTDRTFVNMQINQEKPKEQR